MSRSQDQARTHQDAGRYLENLLRRPGPYRTKWEHWARKFGLRFSPGTVSQAAVTLAIAEHYDRVGLLSNRKAHKREARRWKDRVSRAFGGLLSKKTLRAFIDTFGISQEDLDRLQLIQSGDEDAAIVIGQLVSQESVSPPQHQTILQVEEHYVGPDGLPSGHITQQTIRALKDDLKYFPYPTCTDQVAVTVLSGGTAGDLSKVTEGLWEVPIVFSGPLQRGQTKQLKIRSRFHHECPQTAWRYTVTGRLDGLQLQIKFNPKRVPSHVWWTQWSHWADNSLIVDEVKVDLDDELCVHRHIQYIERAVVGFRWTW